MWKNNKGFSLVEMLVALIVVVTVVATTIPIFTLIQTERKQLEDKRKIMSVLHEQLNDYIWHGKIIEVQFVQIINGKKINIIISSKNNIIEGCVTYQNERHKDETICLYGYVES